jgi:VWFA-related protein
MTFPGSASKVTGALVLGAAVVAIVYGSDQPTVIPVATSRVTVDFVVRDNHRRLVSDLMPTEVEVLEDGVAQRIESLQLVRRTGATPAPTTTAGGTPLPTQALPPATAASDAAPDAVVAIAFDRMDSAARSAAHKALMEYLDGGPRADLVGLFSIDPSLTVLQPFSDDLGRLRQAADDFLTRAATPFNAATDVDRLWDLRQREAALTGGESFDPNSTVYVAAAESRGAAGPTLAQTSRDNAELHRIRMEARILDSFIQMERDQQGLSTMNSLLALIDGVREIRGRKSVLLFSQGPVRHQRPRLGTASHGG